jgi:hypothetical protein
VNVVQALPFVVVCGIISAMLVRSREVKWWAAILIYLFGFYTALTPAVYMVGGLVKWTLGRFI